MMVEVLGKQYEVIEIIPKKYPEQDLFICKSKYGFKECFQRFDIGREPRKVKMTDGVDWTCKEVQIVKEALNNNIPIKDIATYSELNRHTENAIIHKATTMKREMLWKEEAEREKRREPRFKVRF